MTRDELRAFLARDPPAVGACWRENELVRPWAFWFTRNGDYLGTRSSRTGPDDVNASQKCNCEQCERKP